MNINNIVLNKDSIYLLFPKYMGDTFILCGFLEELKKVHNSNIILIIKSKQIPIMNLLNIHDYIVADWKEEQLLNLSKKCPKIQKGKIFIAHWYVHSEILNSEQRLQIISNENLKNAFAELLSLPPNLTLNYNFNPPNLSENLSKKIKDIAPVDKIVLLSPEAYSVEALPDKYWENLVVKIKQDGFIPVSSVMSKKNTIKGSIYIPLDFQEALELAYNCAHVYALRSGFGDCCIFLQNKLTLLYTSYISYNHHNMRSLFNNNNINEELVVNDVEQEREIYIFGIKTPFTIIFDKQDILIKFFGFNIFTYYNRMNLFIVRICELTLLKIKQKKQKYYISNAANACSSRERERESNKPNGL